MARARRTGGLGESFTFGGRLPPVVGVILVVMLVTTVLAWLQRGLGGLAALYPDAILGGQVWRLVSWAFVQGDPFQLIFVGLMLFWLGPQLVWAWGERRFLLTYLGIAAAASALTTLVAVAWAGAGLPHAGAWPVMNALLVLWGLAYPDRVVSWFGVVNMTGQIVAYAVLGGTVLWAIFAGLGAFVPHFMALAIAWGLASGFGTRGVRRGWLGVKDAWLEWRLRRRSRHLKVVSKKNGADDRPRYLN